MSFVQRFGLILVVTVFLMMTAPHTAALPPDFFRPVYVTVNYFCVGYFVPTSDCLALAVHREML